MIIRPQTQLVLTILLAFFGFTGMFLLALGWQGINIGNMLTGKVTWESSERIGCTRGETNWLCVTQPLTGDVYRSQKPVFRWEQNFAFRPSAYAYKLSRVENDRGTQEYTLIRALTIQSQTKLQKTFLNGKKGAFTYDQLLICYPWDNYSCVKQVAQYKEGLPPGKYRFEVYAFASGPRYLVATHGVQFKIQ